MNLLNIMKATNSPPATAVFATRDVTNEEVEAEVASALVFLSKNKGVSLNALMLDCATKGTITHDMMDDQAGLQASTPSDRAPKTIKSVDHFPPTGSRLASP